MLRKIVVIMGLMAAAVLLPSVGDGIHAQENPAVSVCDPARPADAAGMTRNELESGGLQRGYVLYVPETYDPTVPTALVISIHGFASWPEQQMDISEWNALADEHGFVVVYPAGTGFPRRWSTGGGFDNSENPVDDVGFVADLMDTLVENLCIDPARIYVNGLSNGGGMSYLLACRLAERIAAIGSVAGAYLEPNGGCQPARPMPVIAFHGTKDRIVPYNGQDNAGFNFPPVEAWAADWGVRNGCDAAPENLPESGAVSGVQYVNCDGSADVIFYTIDGGGHTWPGGGDMPAMLGLISEDIDASAAMWEFFVAHPLK